jgi:flagellar P-ring protein FlgI
MQSNSIVRSSLSVLIIVAGLLSMDSASIAQTASNSTMLVRLKDIAKLSGQREETVTGFGLVVGLNGTGGKDLLTQQRALNIFKRSGNNVQSMNSPNVSTVLVTAKIPAFKRKGEKITATVAVFDSAKSLLGGVLVQTALKGLDDKIYAIADGAITIGGFSAGGAAATVTKNHPTTGFVDATLEVDLCRPDFGADGSLYYQLENPDRSTAQQIVSQINFVYGKAARVEDAGRVSVRVPEGFRDNINAFVVDLDEIRVTPDQPARIIINERNGVLVMGQNVRISPTVLASDNLVVTTTESPEVSQPAPFSAGETTVVPRTDITVTSEGGDFQLIQSGTTVSELIKALNALGASPRDLIGIIRELKASGAIHAELIVM